MKKSWYRLLEYYPRIPNLYGFPNTHKSDIPNAHYYCTTGERPTPKKLTKAIKIIKPLNNQSMT